MFSVDLKRSLCQNFRSLPLPCPTGVHSRAKCVKTGPQRPNDAAQPKTKTLAAFCGFYLLLKVLLVFRCSLLLFRLLRLFPGYTRLLVAMLAADVAESAFLPFPWQPPQFQVRVGR